MPPVRRIVSDIRTLRTSIVNIKASLASLPCAMCNGCEVKRTPSLDNEKQDDERIGSAFSPCPRMVSYYDAQHGLGSVGSCSSRWNDLLLSFSIGLSKTRKIGSPFSRFTQKCRDLYLDTVKWKIQGVSNSGRVPCTTTKAISQEPGLSSNEREMTIVTS